MRDRKHGSEGPSHFPEATPPETQIAPRSEDAAPAGQAPFVVPATAELGHPSRPPAPTRRGSEEGTGQQIRVSTWPAEPSNPCVLRSDQWPLRSAILRGRDNAYIGSTAPVVPNSA